MKYAKFFVSAACTVLGAVAVPLGWPVWTIVLISAVGTVLVGGVPNKKAL